MDDQAPGPDSEALDRLRAELKGESPRGIVLISAAMLEEALRDLLLTFLVPNPSSTDTLFDGPNGPLSTFSAKIDFSFRVGLVSGKFCRDLHIIRRIRNDVAHKPVGFSFADASASSRIAELSRSHGIFERSPKWVAENGPPSAEAQFFEAASWMLYFLVVSRSRVEALSERAREFGYSFEIDDPSDSSGPDA